MGLFDEIKGEVEAFSCFRKPNWLQEDVDTNSVPWREEENSGTTNRAIGSRQHAFKSIWEQSLDPLGQTKNNRKKSARPETWSIDWKKWPPHVPRFPKGVKIPVMVVPQVDLRLSLSGRWDEITHGKTVIPVNYENKKFFDNLGGHLNLAKSVTCKVTPSSLLFLHTKVGQFYSVKLKLDNIGNIPRRVRILSPANSCFTVIRHGDSKDAISPGWCLKVEVKYRPKTNESLNDSLVFIIDRDGSVVVPLISSSVPEPILEVEEWNCGCCVVGIPRTEHFEIKNVGGEGKFWILSEDEFSNEYLECYLKFRKNLIKESTKEILKLHKEAIDGNDDFNINTVIGRGEALGMIKRKRDSLDEDRFGSMMIGGKIQPRICTKNFRIQPSCFHLQRNQRISITVRYLPIDANFHYEKLCIMCENGEVRWIAVKGVGIERDSDKLIEIKAQWTGPPVDLPSDPRTKFVLDCGDLISGELAKLTFSIANKSCIPLYFFWCIRPVLTDPEASPDKTEAKVMERFYEATMYDPNRNTISNLNFAGEDDKSQVLSTVGSSSFIHFTVNPSQGMLEKKQELKMTFKAQCPAALGYHGCVISLFVEQVDEESKSAVLETLRDLDKDQLNHPLSHAHLNMEVPTKAANENSSKDKEEKVIFVHKTETSTKALQAKQESVLSTIKSIEKEDNFVPLKDTIKEIRKSLDEIKKQNPKTDSGNAIKSNEMILPLVVARRSTLELQLMEQEKLLEKAVANLKNKDKDKQQAPPKSPESGDAGLNIERKESINIHYLAESNSVEEKNREMYDGHGIYEDLKNYTANIIPQYKLWPNREKTLTPVAEVEIWLHSVPLDVTFYPPFIVVNGLVKTSMERLVKVRNGTKHNLEMNFENICDDSVGSITCHPKRFSVKPHDISTFKVAIFFEKYGEMQRTLCGTIALPFLTTPCYLSCYLKSYGPFLQVLNPTINFGIVPLYSETMKTLALKNGGNRPLKWVARIAPEGMEDEHRREISGHQARIHDKRLIRIWPEWGLIEPGESAGMQVYFCAELSGEIASYVEVMVEGNPQSLISVPVYGEIELPFLVLENGLIKFFAEDFAHHTIQNAMCSIINPTGFNVPYTWQCPVGRQNKICSVYIQPKEGIIPAKAKNNFTVSVETFTPDEPLELDNLFVPCCVEGMREPLILRIISEH